MKHQTETADRRKRQPRSELVGKIVHVQYSAREFLMNDFAVILQETAKSVVLARLATVEHIDQKCEYYAGREQPLLQDGKLAAVALVKVYRGIVTGGIEIRIGKPSPKTMLIAQLRMDEKFFHHSVRIQSRRPQPGEVLVQAIRVFKDEMEGVVKSFSSRTHCYYLWDGQAHGFAYPGLARPKDTLV